ncbi:MAG: hypothetical protein HC857_13955 [Synechococcales cyanobacterium RU_4_20]|nr:hypothetical protein [Synechococcales cyanobacterium RU_4_20]
MIAASPPQRSEYIQELGNPYLALFPFRYSYISAPFPDPGQKPNWVTETRHPLSDRLILQGGQLFGVRFDSKTHYCLLDIDIDSPYHPKQDPLAIGKIKEALEPLDLVAAVTCTSSYSGGLHLYFPFKRSQRSWQIASAVSTLLTNKGFKLRGGQLEVFPNTKKYVKTGSPSLFNAHRLPLQDPGSKLLNDDLEPVYSSPERFVELWQRCQAQNLMTAKKVAQVIKQQKRQRVFISEKADKFFNDLEAEINLGWTGKGMTNRLLGRLVMRYFIFHHAVAGGEPLTGKALIDEVVAAAKVLPGYKTWCKHQHELVKRVTDWVRCIENSHYFPYGKELGKYKSPVASSTEAPAESYHQKLVNQTKGKIQAAVDLLNQAKTWPQAITERFQALRQQGIGSNTLYRYKSLWHPEFESKLEEPNPILCDGQPACPQGAAELAHSHKLILQRSGNNLLPEDLSAFQTGSADGEYGNSLPAGAFTGLGREKAISKTKELLAQALVNPPWKRLGDEEEASESGSAVLVQHHEAFLEQHLEYLASGDAILAAEAWAVLAAQLDDAWPRKRQRWYQAVLDKISRRLEKAENPSMELVERCRQLLLPHNS